MDPQNLVAAIAACLSPDASVRKAGEEAVKQQPHHPGGLTSLLSIAMEPSTEPAVRQIAAIAVKNAIKKEWEDRETGRKESPFSEAEKSAIRDRLLEGICHAPHAVRVQLEEGARNIVICDYPQRWPNLLPSLQTALSSHDVQVVAGALRILRLIARKYEFSDADDREPMLITVNATFPSILKVFQQLLENPDPSVELAEMLKLCCKIFWSSCYMEIPPILTEEQHFNEWMMALLGLASRPLPRDKMPEDNEEREKWPWWKAKKWVYHIFKRLFRRYGDHRTCGSAVEVAFSKLLQEACVDRFLAAVLSELSAVARREYVAPRVSNNLLGFLSDAVRSKNTWRNLKPHIQDVVAHAVLPLLAFNEDDAELWQDDPQEYVRKGYDVIEDIYSSKTAAMTLLYDLCTMRKKTQLDPTMAKIVEIFNEARASAREGNEMPVDVARKLDGALLAVGSLESILKKESRYRDQLGPMLVGHVVPLFSSSYGHLRAKSVWLAGIFCDARFADGMGRGATFSTLLQGVVSALGDSDLPVRVDAAVAVRQFLHTLEDEDLGVLRPLVPDLLKRFLDLSREAPAEDITESLQTLVERFGHELAPYAVNIMTALVQQFWHVVQDGEEATAAGVENDEEDFDGSGPLAGYTLLSAMETVLEAISSVPHLYPQMEELLFPILERFTSQDGLDVFEEITALMTYLTYSASTITPRMWTLYPRLLTCLNDWAQDYWEDCLPAIDNFVSRGTDTFLMCSEPPLLLMTNQTLERALSLKPPGSTDGSTRPTSNADANEDEDSDFSYSAIESATCAAQIISIILHHCRSRVDDHLGAYLALLSQQLLTEGAIKGGRSQMDAMMLAILDALYYNAVLTMRLLAQMGVLESLLTYLTSAALAYSKSGRMRHFKSLRSKKIVVLGLASILAVPAQALPPTVGGMLGDIAVAALRVLIAYKEKEERSTNEIDQGGDDADDSGSDGLSRFGANAGGDEGDDDDDGSYDEDEDVLFRRARAAARAASHYEDIEEDDNDDSDDDDFWSEEDDDDGIKSPIDDISPYIFFAEALQSIQASDPAKFASVTSKMDANTQIAAQGMIDFASHLRSQSPK